VLAIELISAQFAYMFCSYIRDKRRAKFPIAVVVDKGSPLYLRTAELLSLSVHNKMSPPCHNSSVHADVGLGKYQKQ